MKPVALAERLPILRLLGYSLGSFGTGVFSTVPAVLLLYFCTQILAIPAQYAALVVFLPKAWAIFWDPFVGIWSDQTRTKLGRRRPFLLAGGLGIILSFVALFAWPHPNGMPAMWTTALFYFCLATTYSLFAVPYVAFPAEASSLAAERERIVAWRIGFAMIGALIGSALAPLLVGWSGGGRHGYAVMSVVVAAICAFGMAAAYFSVPSHPSGVVDPPPFAWRRMQRVLLENPDFLKLGLAYVLQLTAVGVLSALAPYWVVFTLGRPEGETGLLLGVMLLATIASTPAWAALVRALGGRAAIAVAVVLYVVGSLGSIVGAGGHVAVPFAVMAVIGVAFGGLQVAPFALAAHLVNQHGFRTGERQEGLMTGLWTAGEKLGLALGPAVAGVGLAVTGFVSGATVQDTATGDHIAWLMGIAPAIFALLSLVPLLAMRSPRPGPL